MSETPSHLDAPLRVIVLGSTGSIGRSTLEVIAHLNALGQRRIEVAGLAAGRNAALLAEQAERFNVPCTALLEPPPAAERTRLGTRLKAVGPRSAAELVGLVDDVDLVVAAIVGFAGLAATWEAVSRGINVALANKEALVAGGEVVTREAARSGSLLLPVDSEHSAIFQCLQGADTAAREVRQVVLTASGGPFRTWERQRILEATAAEALKHPTWSMGAKVTVDSASLANKGLELIEAKWLFDLDADCLGVLVHPQSIVHSFVEFVDGSVLAQLGAPDMKTPIQYALTWPHRCEGCSRRLDFAEMRRLDFEEPDLSRFPMLGHAWAAIREGGRRGAVFSAANEVAVESFLQGAIPFGRIAEVVGETLARVGRGPADTLDAVAAADSEARETARSLLG